MPESTIPSPADAVKASLADATASAANNDTTQEVAETKTAKAAETTTETKATEAKATDATAAKSLSESIESDEAPAAKAKEVAPATTDEPREGEKPAQFIKRLKQERADALAQIEQLKAKTVQKQDATPDEIAALRKEIAERDELIETTAFEKSRKFQEQFAKPLEKATTAAKDLISKFTETKGVFEQAKALDGKERMEFLKEHIGEAASTVFDRMARIDEIASDRDAAVKDRGEIAKTLAAEREAQGDAETIKAFEAQRESIASKLSVYRSDKADALVSQARALLTGDAPAADIISAAYLAVAAPHYIAELKAARAENATLKARIAEDAGDRAALHGRGGEGVDASKGFIKDGRVLPMGEVLKKQMQSA